MMREVITRFGRHNLGVLWLMAEPMLFTAWRCDTLVRAASESRIRHSNHRVCHHRLLVGARLAESARARARWRSLPTGHLLFHRNVRVIDVLLTRSILEIGGATGSFFVLTRSSRRSSWMALAARSAHGDASVGCCLCWFGVALGLLDRAPERHTPRSSRSSGPRPPTCSSRFRAPPSWSSGFPRSHTAVRVAVSDGARSRDGARRLLRPRRAHALRRRTTYATICLVMTLLALALYARSLPPSGAADASTSTN